MAAVSNIQRRVLIISYHFPPLTGGGVFRPLKFAKYLPEFGWQPIILAVEPTKHDTLDHTLLEQLQDSVIVHRVPHIHPKTIESKLKPIWSLFWKLRLRSLANATQPYKLMQWIPPDPCVGWVRPALRKARELIATYQPDILFTTSPPHSTQLIGLGLKREAPLWIADFRDPWTRNPFVHFPIAALQRLNSRWERKVLQRADAVVCVTETMHRWVSEENETTKVVCIDNGYDLDDFKPSCAPKPNNQAFTLAYTGSLYGVRRLIHALEAVNKLVQNGRIGPYEIKFQFMGRDGTGCTKQFQDQPWLEILPVSSHEQVVQLLYSADVSVLLVPSVGIYIPSRKSTEYPQVPGKLFEYLKIPNPILALVPDISDTANIIRKTGMGLVVNPDKPDAIAEAIMELFTAWRHGTLRISPDQEEIARYDRRHLTGQLVQLFEQTLSPHHEQ